jgi:hypothetical protein
MTTKPAHRTLLDETLVGQFLLSFYGRNLALGFRGPKDFVERGGNMAYNSGMTNGRLHWLHNTLGYILTDEERLMKGLKRHFYGEIIMNGEVPHLKCEVNDEGVEIEYDEPYLNKLAEERARAFREDHIESLNFMMYHAASLAPIYALSSSISGPNINEKSED